MKFGVVDNEAHEAIGKRFDVSAYPTVLVFLDGDQLNPIRYKGDRDLSSLVEFLLEQIAKRTEKRALKYSEKLFLTKKDKKPSGESAGGSCGGSGSRNRYGGSQSGQCSGGGAGGKTKQGSKGKSGAIDLTEASFNELVVDGTEPWMVAFVAPWCPHCMSFIYLLIRIGYSMGI